MTPDAWDDGRLGAAFAAMSTKAQAPTDLPTQTMAAVRAASVEADRRSPPWARLLPLAAGLATVAASLAIVVVLTDGLSPVGPTGSATPSATAWTGAGGPPRVADLPRLTVQDLLARIDAGPTADEVIVHGWLGRSSAAVDCEFVAEPHPLMPYCEELGLFLMQEEAHPDGGGPGLQGPTVPFIIPMLRFDAQIDTNPLPGQVVEVLAVGHLLDHRWPSCPPGTAQECRGRFVIDRVVPADHEIAEIPERWLRDADPRAVPTDVVSTIESVVGDVEVVSIGVLPSESITSIEPEAGLLGMRYGTDLLWVVRALTTGPSASEAATYLLPAAPLRGRTADAVFLAGAAGLQRIVGPGDVRSPESLPSSVLGLDIIDVEAALAVRDRPGDDTEIAVSGWYWRDPTIQCAAPTSAVPLLDPACPDDHDRLVIAPDAALVDGSTLQPVVGAWMRDGLPGPWWSAPVVLVGHFDDRRASACVSRLRRVWDRREACADVFWVDSIWSESIQGIAEWTLKAPDGDAPPPARTDRGDFEPWAQRLAGDAVVLAVGLVDRRALATIEPAFVQPLLDDAWAWHLTVLDLATRRVRTYVVPEATLVDAAAGGSYTTYEVVGDEIILTTTMVD